MPYDTINPDDAQSILYGSTPKTNITVQPTVQENTPIEPPKQKEKKEKKTVGVEPPSLAQQVTNTMDVLTANTPMPTPSSPLPQVSNTYGDLLNSVANNWMAVGIPTLAYGAYKLGKSIEDGQPKPVQPTTPIADRQIVKIEPKMDVNQASQGRVEPTFNQPTNVTSSNELPPEVLNSPGYQKFTELEKKTGGPITTASDLALVVKSEENRIAKEQEALKKAEQAGVTPSTSLPEAQTLVTTSEAAKDPLEKAQQVAEVKSVEGAVKPKTTKAKNPVESMKSYLMGSQGFNEEQYNTLMKDIIGKNLEMPSTGGGFGPKSHPEEWNKYMAWRKENIEGPKTNINYDIKKKLKEVEAIEDPKARLKARNALLTSLAVLPAFVNAKTPQQMREARQALGEAFLPIGATPTEAGAPTLPPNAYSESRKLGSPFRQQLLGIAPPTR